MELGRLITLADGEKLSLIRVSWLTKIFVGGDVLSFLMQSSGKQQPNLSFNSTLITDQYRC